MKKWEVKKLLVASMIFLFTTMAFAPIEAEATSITDTVKVTKEAIAKSVIQAPLVNVLAPQVVKMGSMGDDDVRGSKIFIREVDDSRSVMNALMSVSFDGLDNDLVSSTSDGYGGDDGAYVNLSSSDVMSGMLNVDRLDPTAKSRLKSLCDNHEKLGIDAIALNTQVMPKVIEVATVNVKNELSKHHLLAMESWNSSSLDKTAVKTMLNRSYSTFKAYSEMLTRRGADSVDVNTGFWGTDNGVDPFVSTTIQMMAAQMSGVDSLTFHYADENPQVIKQAQDFLQAHQGQNVSDILDALLGQ